MSPKKKPTPRTIHDDEKFMRALNYFLEADMGKAGRSDFIEGATLTVYMRLSRRSFLIEHTFKRRTIELARIEVKPQYQKRGILNSLLKHLETVGYAAIFIEGVLQPDHVGIYTRRGYQSAYAQYSWFKIISDEPADDPIGRIFTGEPFVLNTIL